MSSIEIIHPFLLKRRQWSTTTPRFARKPPQLFEIRFEFGVDDCECGPVALLCNPVGFPFLLLGDWRQGGFAGEHACGDDGLPLKDFECESCADLQWVSLISFVVLVQVQDKSGVVDIQLPQKPKSDLGDKTRAGIDLGRGCCASGLVAGMATSR